MDRFRARFWDDNKNVYFIPSLDHLEVEEAALALAAAVVSAASVVAGRGGIVARCGRGCVVAGSGIKC